MSILPELITVRTIPITVPEMCLLWVATDMLIFI